jgi:hypothetical protein
MSAARVAGANRSSTVNESPIQPVWIAARVITVDVRRLNRPRPAAPRVRAATTWRAKLDAAASPVDSTAAIAFECRRRNRVALRWVVPLT